MMTPDFATILQALAVPPKRALTLHRLVSREALGRITPPNYLYTTGYAYRVNSAGTQALYGAEDPATATTEWHRHAAKAPPLLTQVLFFLEIDLPVLDLGDSAVLTALGLTEADLQASWQFAAAPTKLQLLGDAVAGQQRFGAVRFPSDAARARGFSGHNLVMFPSAIVTPMSVVIRDDAGTEIQRWPQA